jgi:hypothetical protein
LGVGGFWGGACRAYTIWNGRPVVLTLECEHFGGGRARNLGLFDHIVDSFRFLD